MNRRLARLVWTRTSTPTGNEWRRPCRPCRRRTSPPPACCYAGSANVPRRSEPTRCKTSVWPRGATSRRGHTHGGRRAFPRPDLRAPPAGRRAGPAHRSPNDHGVILSKILSGFDGNDFERTYGERGVRYAEVHHVTPLRVTGQTNTRLVDLAMLCANCHSMIHRGSQWLTPAELRSRVQQRRAQA
jgi:hypothetical protein